MPSEPRRERHPGDQLTVHAAVKGYVAAALVGLGWIWAATLLATRRHLTGNYEVMPTAPLLWGNLGLPAAGLLFALSAGMLVAILCGYVVRTKGAVRSAVAWLAISWAIPVLDGFRVVGLPIPMTFLEPLLLASVTGAAVGELAEIFHAPLWRGRDSGTGWFAAVGLAAILLGGWWYHQGQQAYDNYLLGYNDFGHFAWRVANTWAGRGFARDARPVALLGSPQSRLGPPGAAMGSVARSAVVFLPSGDLLGGPVAGDLMELRGS